MQTNLLRMLAVFVLLACGGAHGQTPVKQRIDPAVAKLGSGFVSSTANVNGVTIHYVRGGTGPAVVLLHGFPQDWFAYHRIMPRLAKSFTVIAADMRGVGRSTAPRDSFDASNVAADIRQLAQVLKLEPVYIAGHDNGAMVAYTYARLYPAQTRGVMILNSPLPGIEPWNESQGQSRPLAFRISSNPALARKIARRPTIRLLPRIL